MTKQEEIINTIRVLKGELKVHQSRLKPAGKGHLHTAIGVITSRIDELIEEVTAPYWKDEDGDIGRLPGQTRESHLRSVEGAFEQEDVYDGFEEHTEAMQQARLRSIQNSAAGKPNAVRDAYLHSSRVKPMEGEDLDDDVEHTKEYYDTERNRAPNIQTMTSDGLSNRTMKQKHGQAVMTVSEMMQDELEPLPINTFE